MSKMIAVVSKQCVACGTCLKKCPKGAIHIEKGIIAVVNESLCIGCGLCEKTCHASVITRKVREEHE